MKRGIILIILLLIAVMGSGQNNSLKDQILQYDNSTSELISKARRILIDNIIVGEANEIKTWKNYLIDSLESKEYISLYKQEKDLLSFWTDEYDYIISELKNYPFSISSDIEYKIHPLPDNLYRLLLSKTAENVNAFQYRINTSSYTKEEKDIVYLFLMVHLRRFRELNITQDSLNTLSNKFIKEFPSSEYERFVKEFVRYESKSTAIGGAISFAIGGATILTNKLGEHFSNSYSIGFGLEIFYKNLGLFTDGTINFSKSKKDIIVNRNLDIWKSNSQASYFLGNISIGYAIIDKKIKIIPQIGIAMLEITPTQRDEEKYAYLEDFKINRFSYSSGVIFEYKLKHKALDRYNINKYNHFSLKAKYTFYYPQFAYSSIYKGLAHNVTFGFNIFGRGEKRKL